MACLCIMTIFYFCDHIKCTKILFILVILNMSCKNMRRKIELLKWKVSLFLNGLTKKKRPNKLKPREYNIIVNKLTQVVDCFIISEL